MNFATGCSDTIRESINIGGGTDQNYGPIILDVPKEVSKEDYEKLVINHFNGLKQSQENRIQLERETIAQRNSKTWHKLHRNIITASKFGLICRMRETTFCSNMVSSICYPKEFTTEAIQWGITNEPTAKKALERKLNKTISPCGLFIDAEIPYLGATPDGLIDDDGIVEIKCLFSIKDKAPEKAIQEKNFTITRIFDKSNLECMNTTHFYYYQVQGQLHITNRQYCIFAVWTLVDLKYVTVQKDDEFWRLQMEPLLSRFYMQCLLPEILVSRHNQDLPIRDPQYILKAREEKNLKKRSAPR